MIECLNVEQGSPEWLQLRLGVITASKMDCVVAGTTTAKRNTYMLELIAEVCTGLAAEINAKQLSWGKNYEDAARTAYEFATGFTVRPCGFLYKDESKRVGCSPDAMIIGKNRGGEFKCPYSTKNHIEFLTDAKVKSEYILQCQTGIWVTGFDFWDFGSFDPRMKSKMFSHLPIERDPKTIALFEDAVPQFIFDMDKRLAQIGVTYGQQWQIDSGSSSVA